MGSGLPHHDRGIPGSGIGSRGRHRDYAASWFPVHDAAGEIGGAGLMLLEAGGHPAEEEIRRSEERYRSLVQGGAQVVWVAAPDGAMKEDSPEWRWITGQSTEDYLGHGWLAAVHPDDRERVERDWRECVRTGKVFDDRYRIRTKNGSYRHLRRAGGADRAGRQDRRMGRGQ